ncbi:MAG TPA: FHA domain-containing protein, partial [Ornithinibacter sp.]|nr:FHA domain-containing protein [Ornithinibacter sp.]
MSTFTCPNGHASAAADYCDTCGVPIPTGAAATGAVTPATPAAPAAPPDPAAPQPCPNCGTPRGAAALFCEACGYDFTTGSLPRPPDPSTGADAASVAAGGGDQAPLAPARTAEWVVEVWVDPDWYQAQESDDPCPSPGLPIVVELAATSVLVGRPSTSRNIHPEVDCTGDPGVSRRQAQLTTDGQRWWVEDLQSSNGT